MKRTYSHIDLDERRQIACWRMAGLSVETIATIARSDDTVRRSFVRSSATCSSIGRPRSQWLLLRNGTRHGLRTRGCRVCD
mgnify:CR=1 FL=1